MVLQGSKLPKRSGFESKNQLKIQELMDYKTSLVIRFVFRQLDRDFIICLGNVLFEYDTALYYPEAAADVFQTEAHIAFI